MACLGLALTSGVWFDLRRDAQIDGRARFDMNNARTVTLVRGRLIGHLRMIEHVSAMIGVTWPISQQRFELFTTRTHLAQRYPAFHGLTFVQALPGKNGTTRAVIERTDGYPGSLPQGTDVTVMLSASGFAMPTAAQPLSILPISATFRAFLELFTRARNMAGNPHALAVVDTMAIRRVVLPDGRLLGWLTSPARISDALPSVGSPADADLGASLELLQGSSSTPVARIEGEDAGSESSPLHRRQIVDTDGVRWGITIWENPARMALSTGVTTAIWGAGLLLTLMALLVVTTRTSARRRLERAHAELDAETLRARSDALTGLVNRDGLIAALQDTIGRARQDGSTFGVLFIDLDGFKAINDSLGHEGGDEVLVEAAARLRRAVRAGDVVARFAGDEFVVICERLERPTDAEAVAAKLAAALRVPMQLKGGRRDIAGSIGVALAGAPHTIDERTLLREADAAMYEAKRTGRDAVVYAEHLGARALARTGCEERLRQAIEGGELLAALPADPGRRRGRRGRGPGALAAPGARPARARRVPRGRPPRRPPLAARRGDAARGLRPDGPLEPRPPAPAACPGQRGRAAAARRRVPGDGRGDRGRDRARAELLTLEISEDVALERLGAELTVLRELRALGVTLSVDDFGLGRSTFAALRALDMVSELKIDRSFISGIDASSTDQALVRAMVALAGEVGLHVVAEGVETPAELREVSRLGVRSVQGFHLARPAAAADVELLLEPRADAA